MGISNPSFQLSHLTRRELCKLPEWVTHIIQPQDSTPIIVMASKFLYPVIELLPGTLLVCVLIWGQRLFTFCCLYVALIAVAGVLFQGDIIQCQMCNLTPLTWLPLWIWLIFHYLTTVLISTRLPGTKWSSNVCHYFATFSFNMSSMIQLLNNKVYHHLHCYAVIHPKTSVEMFPKFLSIKH